MAKRRKSKVIARLQKSVRSTLQEASKRLQHGELKAAHKVASEVFLRAKQDLDKELARQLLVESAFRLLLKTQEPLEKLQLIDSALEASPQETRLRFQRGIVLLQSDRAGEALQEFDAVTEREPDREGLAFFPSTRSGGNGENAEKKLPACRLRKKIRSACLKSFNKNRRKRPEKPHCRIRSWGASLCCGNSCSRCGTTEALLPQIRFRELSDVPEQRPGIRDCTVLSGGRRDARKTRGGRLSPTGRRP